MALSGVNSGDTAFVLACTGLVMLMTPGLAFFYAGMVRGKNALGTMMQSFAALAVISVQWVLFGYSLAFGPDHHGLIGGLSWVGLSHVGALPNPAYAATIPHAAFMLYQMMFAAITPALITGAFAERKRFTAYLVFMVLWSTLVYDPVAHWVWGMNGWLNRLGAMDFAGGTVVHISSGVTALVAAVVLGRRQGYPRAAMRPHNMTLTLVGTALLWFGWFGFNGGSALAANGLAVNAIMVTHVAAAAGMLGWMAMEYRARRQCTALGAASGAVAGLVGITPASGFVGPLAAVAIGMSTSAVCFLAVAVKSKLGYDDSLDAFGVHGVGGMFGALATGVFASAGIQAGRFGLLEGNARQLGIQAIGVLVVAAYSAIVSFGILKALGAVMELRVSLADERVGLDVTQHGEEAYALAAMPAFATFAASADGEVRLAASEAAHEAARLSACLVES